MKDGPEAATPALPAALRPEIETLETSGIAQVFALGIGRDDVIPLWVGEGDRPTPDFICEAAIASLRAGETFYSHKRGLPELRQAITDYTNRLYGTAVDAEQVTVTGSGMSAMVLVLQVADIPRTKSGKIVELAVRDVIHGRPVKNQEALANPEALALYAKRGELGT